MITRAVQRLGMGLLATAAFTVAWSSSASANDPIREIEETVEQGYDGVVDRVFGEHECEPFCQNPGEDCLVNDENYEGRICLPFSQSELVAYTVYWVDGVIERVEDTAEPIPSSSPNEPIENVGDLSWPA